LDGAYVDMAEKHLLIDWLIYLFKSIYLFIYLFIYVFPQLQQSQLVFQQLICRTIKKVWFAKVNNDTVLNE